MNTKDNLTKRQKKEWDRPLAARWLYLLWLSDRIGRGTRHKPTSSGIQHNRDINKVATACVRKWAIQSPCSLKDGQSKKKRNGANANSQGHRCLKKTKGRRGRWMLGAAGAEEGKPGQPCAIQNSSCRRFFFLNKRSRTCGSGVTSAEV